MTPFADINRRRLLCSALLLVGLSGCGNDLHVGVCRPNPGPTGPAWDAPSIECALVLEVDPFSCQAPLCTEHSQECVIGGSEDRLGKFCRDESAGVECGVCARSGNDIVCQASAQPILSALTISGECVESVECRPCREPAEGEVFDPEIHDFSICPDNDDICSPAEGCFETYKEAGTPCGEAPCMEPGACNAEGECIASNTPKDCDDGDPCTVDSCDPDSGQCVNTPKDCDDGDACTSDTCDDETGECESEATDCDDDDPCTDDTCDSDTGQCLNTPKVCEDEDPCTTNACDPQTGECTFESECDDDNPCTIDDCTDGCTSSPKPCDDGDLCTVDTCDVATGDCIFTPIGCDDQNGCTDDVCNPDTGDCDSTPKTCDDSDPCTTDLCDDMTEQCVNTPLSCDDQNLCTNDSCVDGQCVNAPIDCPAGDQCEVSTCNPATGECGVAPTPSPIPSSSCCSGHFGPGCDDSVCESCVCDAYPECCGDQGVWDEACALATEAECAAECTVCNGAGCCNVPPESGVPFGGCSNAPCETCVCAELPSCCEEDGWTDDCSAIANNACGTTCTQCTGFIPCDDNNPCTLDDRCTEGCSGTPKICDDEDGCTNDICNETTGDCETTPVTCDDDSLCTTDSCVDGACVFAPIDCPAGECEVATCDPETGTCGTAPTPSPIPNNSCCYSHESAGCEDTVCQDCVCAQFPFCCEDDGGTWSEDCVLATEAFCTTECSVCNGVGCCDVPQGNDFPFTGCSNDTCESCVCDIEPSCCSDGDWGANCSAIANDQCGVACNQCTGIIPCDDGNLCTENDQCGEGCSGTPIDCDDEQLCTIDSCNEATGECETAPNPCDDSNLCTTDSCDPGEGGLCVNVPKECDDSNVCTSNSCNPDTGDCEYPAKPSEVPTSSCCSQHSGAGCDDATCESCVCAQAPWCCDGQSQGFWDEFCVGLTESDCTTECSQCNGAACCSVTQGSDTPFSGCSNTTCETCVCAVQPSCCSEDWDETCSAIATSAQCGESCAQCGIACNDADACTLEDECVAGTCAGTPIDCTDGAGTCEVASCNSDTGNCEYTEDASLCVDDACQTGECVEGNCSYTPLVDCSDGNECTTDVCDPATGDCSTIPITSEQKSSCCETGTVGGCDDAVCESCVCDMDSFCCDVEWDEYCVAETELCPDECGEVCNGEGCCDGDIIDEIGGIGLCSNVTCSACVTAELALCAVTWISLCADVAVTVCASACTQCAGPTLCDDGEFCTVDDMCLEGSCVGSPNACDDGDVCTVDSCNVDTGQCDNTYNPEQACDDGDPCTVESCEVECFYSPKSCDDEDPCTDDSCNGVTGDCENPAKVSPAPTSTCCTPGGTAGCDDATCSACVCAMEFFAYCCEPGGWDEDCVLATMDAECVDSCTVCEGTGCCEAPQGNDFPWAGCSQNTTCETCVCDLDSTCCSDTWTDDCATLAKTECLDSCTQCQYQPACDDGDFCTVGTTCTEGVCGGGATKDCDDGIQATVDSCDVLLQTCVNLGT